MATTKKKTTETAQAVTADPVVFSKEKILALKRYANRRDLLSVLLKDGQTYTLDRVDTLINNFMKGKVK